MRSRHEDDASWKPSLFIVGAPKCGTTAWAHYLAANPQIQVGLAKEPSYFCRDLRLKREMSFAQYRDNYSETAADAVKLDASVLYLFSADSAAAIRDFKPDARILIFLRDHLSFLRSYHNEMLFQGHENVRDLERAWALSAQRSQGRRVPWRCSDATLLNYPRCLDFRAHVQRYLDAFPADQVCVLWMDHWKQAPDAYFDALQRFVGVSAVPKPAFEQIGKARAHRSRVLAGLINLRPPRPVMDAYYALRGKLGIHGRTRLMYRLKSLNMQDADLLPVPDALRQTIEGRCRDDAAFVIAQAERSRRLLGLGADPATAA